MGFNMIIDPIQKAKELIAWHESEATRLRQLVEMIEIGFSELQKTSVMPVEFGATAPTERVSTEPVIRTASRLDFKSSPTSLILTEAEDLLRIEGKPTSASDIYEKLIRRGIKISGQNPKGNLTAKFATKKDIFSYDKDSGLWSLIEWINKTKTNEPSSKALDDGSKLGSIEGAKSFFDPKP